MERRECVEMNNQPLVSVPVITYNSSKFVLETLESIKAQTYQNIELIISDDCSTDNTIELCQKWVEQNKDRFIRTQIITAETNTGVSANLNRAENVCRGEWVKTIAGDDILMPDCIDIYIKYILEHPDVVYIFGRVEVFGSTKERNCFYAEKVFNYNFFSLDSKMQYEQLMLGENCIPAPTCFYNRLHSKFLEVQNDEKVPMLEDWPRWIQLLEKGVKFHFVDKIVVGYRIHNNSLSTSLRMPIKTLESCILFDLYYRYPYWAKNNKIEAANRLAKSYVDMYKELLYFESQYINVRSSFAYRLGKLLLRPFRVFKKLIILLSNVIISK